MSLDTGGMELQGSNGTSWDGKALIISYARPEVLRQAKIEALERKVRMRIEEERAAAAYDVHALDGAGPSSTSTAADVLDEHRKAELAAAHLGGRDQVKALVVPPQVTQHGDEVRGSSHLVIEGQRRNYQRLLGQHAAAAGGGAAGSGGGGGGGAVNQAGSKAFAAPAGAKRAGAEAGDVPGGGPLPRYRTSDVGTRPDVPKKKVPWGGGGAPYRRPKPKPDPMKVALGTGMLAYMPARVQQPCGLRNAFVTQAQAIEEARLDYEAVKPRRPASAQPLRPAFQHRVSGGGGGGRESDGGEHVAPGDVAAALAASYLQQQVAPGASGGSSLDKWRDVPMVRVTEVDLMAEYRARSQKEAAAAAAAQHAGDPVPTGRTSPRIRAVVRSASMSAQAKAGAAAAAAAAAVPGIAASPAAGRAGDKPGTPGELESKTRRSAGVRMVSPQEEAAAQVGAAAAAAAAASTGTTGAGRSGTYGKAPARGHSVTSISASGSIPTAATGSISTRTPITPGAAQTPGFLRVRPQSATAASAPRLSPPRPASASPTSPPIVYAAPPRSQSPIRRPASASAASRPTAWGSSTQIQPRPSRPPVHPHSAFPTSQSLSATSLGQHRTTYQPVPPEARRARPGSAVPTSKTNSRTRGAARDSLLGSCSGAPWTTTSTAGAPVIPPGLQQHMTCEGSPNCSVSASGWVGTPGQSASGGTSSAGVSLSGGAALPVDPWATLSTSHPTTTDRPLLQDRVLNYTARQYAMSPEEEEDALKQAAAVPGAAAGAVVTRGSISGAAGGRHGPTGMAAADAAAALAAQRQQQQLAASLTAAAAAAAAGGHGSEGVQRTRPQSAPNRRLRPPSAGHWAGRPEPGALRGVQRSPTGSVYDPELQPSPVGNYVNAVAELALD